MSKSRKYVKSRKPRRKSRKPKKKSDKRRSRKTIKQIRAECKRKGLVYDPKTKRCRKRTSRKSVRKKSRAKKSRKARAKKSVKRKSVKRKSERYKFSVSKGDDIKKLKNYAKKHNKIRGCSKKQTTMKYNPTNDFDKLKPYQYTIAKEEKYLDTMVGGEKESVKKVNPGDFVFCGPKNEKYALDPANTKKNYDFSDITTKFIPRKCIIPTKREIERLYGKKHLEFVPSWGGSLMMAYPGDTIVLEKMKVDSGYRIAKSVFDKTYKLDKSAKKK